MVCFIINQCVAKDKYISNLLCDNGLEQYKPSFVLKSMIYTPELASQIIDSLGGEKFIIKRINGFRGEGIIVVEKDQMDFAVKKLIGAYHGDNSHSQDSPFFYWNNDNLPSGDENNPPFFLVEQYEKSKEIEFNCSIYDPTARVIFLIEHGFSQTYGFISKIKYLGDYWKLPDLPISEGTLNENGVSSNIFQQISGEDKQTILGEMNNILPIINIRMLQSTHEHQVKSLKAMNGIENGLYSMYRDQLTT